MIDVVGRTLTLEITGEFISKNVSVDSFGSIVEDIRSSRSPVPNTVTISFTVGSYASGTVTFVIRCTEDQDDDCEVNDESWIINGNQSITGFEGPTNYAEVIYGNQDPQVAYERFTAMTESEARTLLNRTVRSQLGSNFREIATNFCRNRPRPSGPSI